MDMYIIGRWIMDKNLLDYLKANHTYLDLTREASLNLDIMDEDVRKNEIFLTGENHGIRMNTRLKMKFLKYFKRKIDFKYLITELPASVIYFINKYLKTGDRKILKDIYNGLKGTDAWNLEEYNFWIQLYNLNKKLPEEKRILGLGIDIEHQVENALKFMKYSLDIKGLPSTILELVGRLEEEEKFKDDKKVLEFYSGVKKELDTNKSIYKRKLGEKYFLLSHINDNILNKVEVYGSNNFDGVRDSKIYKNFLKLIKGKRNKKFFGQIGLSHVFQKSFPSIDWFGKSLSEESQFKGRVISIAYAYRDCKYLYPTKRRDYIGKIDTMNRALEEFNPFLEEDLSLFRLNNKKSPFHNSLIWPLEHKIPNGGVTTDYFQYLLVIKDSKAMESLKL